MFKFFGKILSKISIGALIREIKLDIDTVDKKIGYGLRVRVEAFGLTLIDEFVKLKSLDEPIDVNRNNRQKIARG